MGAFRRALATISMYLGKLTVSQRLLIGSLAVIMLMTLFVVRQYASTPENVALLEPNASAERQSQALQFVRANFVPHTVNEAGAVMVPPGRQYAVLAQMSQQGKLPDDNHLLFDSLINKQSWTQTYQQNALMEAVAVQNELARIIGMMDGVNGANVIMDVPKNRGLGQPRTAPTASVTVFTGKGLGQNAVDAIAHLVASARSGLSVENVRVIDGTTMRQYRARDEKASAVASYSEFQNAIEDRKQRQIYDMLSSYIRGVVVAVHAQVDVTKRVSLIESVLPTGKGSESLVKSENTTERRTTGGSGGGGEAGVRSNAGADISTGVAAGASGPTTNDNDTKTEFETKFGRKTENIEDPRGFATKINAVVNVPRAYFVEIWRGQQDAAAAPAGGADAGAAGGAKAAEPKDADLQPIITAEVERIKREVMLQIDTTAAEKSEQAAKAGEGQVEVSMIHTLADVGEPAVQKAGFIDLGGGTLAVTDLVKTVGLGGMAVLALGLVVMTAFRASKQEKLPTAAELVGVPPTLPGDSDIVGEATEADSVLSGIELSDDEMKDRKVLEQVEAVAKDRPRDAASILSRWMTDG
jgi:flagellar biosynthesis/type III secretory pathway M-ring protein FliF/YscJ